MSTRAQAKKRQCTSKKKDIQNDEEIIEIEEFPITRPTKSSKKKKDNTENSSSEATTPNKKKQKKNNNDKKDKILKNDNELIEIMDIEIPENDSITSNKKKVSAPAPIPPRQKKTVSQIIINNKTKKDEKIPEKSINNNNSKEKSPIVKGKKTKNIQSITLDESENENENNENDIQVNNEVKSPSDKKNITKPQIKKNVNKSKEISNVEEKKNKKNVKNGNVKKIEQNQELIQCELSSSEDIEEEKSDKKQIQKKKDKKQSEINNNSSDIFNSGFLSSQKTSQNKNNISEKNEALKSKSTIKVSLKKDSLKDKMNNLLGRKRKPDVRKEKSKTPDKNSGKSITASIHNQKITSGKKSKTPLKNVAKKKIKTNNLFVPKMNSEQNSKKTYVVPELAVLNQLIIEYGFEKVLDSLCKPKFDQKIKLDSCLQGLKDSCSNDKLPLILFKMFYSYFESKFEEKKVSDKRSISAKKTNNLKQLVENNLEKSCQKTPINENKSVYSMKDQYEDESPIQIEDEEIQEIEDKNEKNDEKNDEKNEKKTEKKNEKNEKKIMSVVKAKTKVVKSPNKQEGKKGEKKTTSIGSHYNKDEEGRIYKYQVAHLDGKGNAIFKCYDDNCTGMGIYEIDTRKFVVSKKHSLKHGEHEYIINYDKDGDNVFKELIEKEKSEAQVFKENGERIVKYY